MVGRRAPELLGSAGRTTAARRKTKCGSTDPPLPYRFTHSTFQPPAKFVALRPAASGKKGVTTTASGIEFLLNGRPAASTPPTEATLLDFIREQGLTAQRKARRANRRAQWCWSLHTTRQARTAVNSCLISLPVAAP